jgi:ornithine cyclodeaminase/alanine dehydrogenase-like protein (mu-crystallin family)
MRTLDPKICVAALKEAYRQHASHRQDQSQSLAFLIEGGSIHVKAGLLPGLRSVFAAKVNVNLPGNPARGRPTVQGALLLADAVEGRPLAVMDSMVLTALRTAGTMALAANYCAKPGSKTAAIIGCGFQAPFQIEALLAFFPLEGVRLYDLDPARARALKEKLGSKRIDIAVMCDVASAVEGADICVTCTTATSPVLTDTMPLKGCFVAAIGADNPEKIEIDTRLMTRARIVVDDPEQCAKGADLAHALDAGLISRERVHADLADLASNAKQGRLFADELVIFDSSGSGIQDVAAAWAAYQSANAKGIGTEISL